jgi:hypothetical protein
MLPDRIRRRLAFIIAIGMVIAVVAAPVAAVTNGELDGNDHPQFVLLLMEVGGEPAYRCSGTLLSATVLLTAGHCASNYPGAPFTGMRVFTESDVENGDNNYPYAGPNSVEATSWAAHSMYEDGPFWLHDVGIVILEKPGFALAKHKYGVLPKADQLDPLKTKRGKTKTRFTSVGYGLQESFPNKKEWKNKDDKVRMVAHPRLLQINGGLVGPDSLLLSNNHNTGGACFGDSGGPNFLGDSLVVAGITSFGMNGRCAGTGGVFRTDRQNVLDFVSSF